jgi:succinylarginine dihydrolase
LSVGHRYAARAPLLVVLVVLGPDGPDDPPLAGLAEPPVREQPAVAATSAAVVANAAARAPTLDEAWALAWVALV